MNRPATPIGKTPAALVTGGAKRVGRAVALRLAADGHDLAVTYRSSEDEARATCDEIKEVHGRRAIPIRADFTPDAVEAAVGHVHDAFRQHFGRLDVLVHNASLYEPSNLWDTSPEQLRRLFCVHAETPLLLTRRLHPLLKKVGGCVVCLTDIQADRPFEAVAGYAATKAALANLVKSMALELAPDVRVNAVAPGVVEWPPGASEDEKRRYLKRVPLGEAGAPEDVAAAVAYLAGGGRYLTGQTIALDGGRLIR